MSRKKNVAGEATDNDSNNSTVATAEPKKVAGPVMTRPDYIEGPPVDEKGNVIQAGQEPKEWGNPYKAIITNSGFEMGENRQFKQRVFLFREKPSAEVLATLKDNGFIYRPAEKAWTIPANADTRKLSDELARRFAGQTVAMSR